MTTLKSLMIVGALLVGTTPLAMAQAEGSSGPDGQLATSAGAADNPPAPGSTSGTSTRAARHHGTRHHRMYMTRDTRSKPQQRLGPMPWFSISLRAVAALGADVTA